MLMGCSLPLPTSRDFQRFLYADVRRMLTPPSRANRPAVLVKMVANYGGAMDPLKITHLITRRDNFYIALITEEIINTDLQITCYGKRTFMTDSFLWVLRGILDKVIFGESWNSFFCRDTATRNTVVATEATKAKLRSALRLCGAGTLLLAPFLLVARLSVFFFRHSDQLRKSSGPVGDNSVPSTPSLSRTLMGFNPPFQKGRRGALSV